MAVAANDVHQSADHQGGGKKKKKLIAVGLRPGSPKSKISPFHTKRHVVRHERYLRDENSDEQGGASSQELKGKKNKEI